jgi:hypothetical protein
VIENPKTKLSFTRKLSCNLFTNKIEDIAKIVMIDNGLNKNDVMSACSLIELKQIENRNKLN